MKKRRNSLILVLFVRLIVSISFAIAIDAQTTSPTPASTPIGGPTSIFTIYDGATLRKGEYTFSAANRVLDVQNAKFASKLMAREMPYRVIVPTSYTDPKKSGDRYPVLYLLHGLFGHFDNWTDKAKVAEYAGNYDFIIVTPEGGDGWYTDSATVQNDKYESYIVKELIPEIDKKFRTVPNREHRAIAGLSMGGYGAIKFGLKYPEMFSLVGGFSGALDGPLRGQDHKNWRPSIMSVFGGDDSQIRKDNDVYRLVRNVTVESVNRLPFIYLDCGTEDVVNFQNNRDFAGLLLEKKIPHEYRELPGAHTWTFWDEQVQEFLRVAERKLPKK